MDVFAALEMYFVSRSKGELSFVLSCFVVSKQIVCYHPLFNIRINEIGELDIWSYMKCSAIQFVASFDIKVRFKCCLYLINFPFYIVIKM